jgi:hypothetical protein
MPPSDFRVVLRSEDRTLRCRAYLGDGVPTPSGGGGGHEVVSIPGRKPVLVWRKADLLNMSLPILIDSFVDDEPVAGEYAGLVRMWRPLAPEDAPPPVKIEADGDSVPFTHLTWRITNLEWGEALATDYGNRSRQAFTVTLTEDNPEERLGAQHGGSGAKRRASKRKVHSKGSALPATHRVKVGETLQGLAAKYKIAGGWRALGARQSPPITDPRNLPVGTLLNLTVGANVATGVGSA